MKIDLESYINAIQKEPDILKKAQLLKTILTTQYYTSSEVAKTLKVTPSYISNLLRLITLPEIVIDGYYAKSISATHLIILSRIKDQSLLISIFEKVLAQSLTTVQTEQLVSQSLRGVDLSGVRADKKTREKITHFFTKIDRRIEVDITQTRRRARVTLSVKGPYATTSQVLANISKLYRSE